MTQKEILEEALRILEPFDPEDPFDVAIQGVLSATLDVKRWEAEEGDPSECVCPQCVATVALARTIIEEEQKGLTSD